MNKLLISSGMGMLFCLAGCNTVNDTANFANSTVGTGVKYTATAVDTGVGFVSNGVGTVVNTGAGVVSGQPVRDTVYHHGHQYIMKNGKYVRIN